MRLTNAFIREPADSRGPQLVRGIEAAGADEV